ncbi:hypothetical protein [Sorangium cellulosum]|uniref:hypothetical protein n=1 Tax=Sorangium cellulosum TaxID=56 RepID=UPI001331A275|nr:hypothetical protein [Sorangium cellulosum]
MYLGDVAASLTETCVLARERGAAGGELRAKASEAAGELLQVLAGHADAPSLKEKAEECRAKLARGLTTAPEGSPPAWG